MTTDDTWTLRRFRLAGQAHLHGARALLASAPGASKGGERPPALLPSSATYLAQVALECAIKARILWRYGFDSAAKLKSAQPTVHERLFKSKHGHNITELAAELRLKEVVAAEGKALADDACWRRLCSSERPYTLRYGAADLDEADAREDIDRVASVTEALFAGLGRFRRPA